MSSGGEVSTRRLEHAALEILDQGAAEDSAPFFHGTQLPRGSGKVSEKGGAELPDWLEIPEGDTDWTDFNFEEMLAKWEEGWARLFGALETVNTENFAQTIYIRNMGHTIVEAVNRQLAHYAYHIGQIVYVGRMLKGRDWQSLSIPKGGSAAYNASKFAQPKRQAHFTDEFLKKDKK